ncbi:hypothetical protein BRC64_07495 [Halobacteriales archaeon QH_10_67_22]|nr:MAG: hypothetical protein BRC64_07495 [Halobacteriales archaeon QH_10_67_22]
MGAGHHVYRVQNDDPAPPACAGGVRFETVNSITSPVGPQGLLFVTASVIVLGYVVTGFVTLARFALDARNAYRTQTAIIFLGATVPVLGSVTYRTSYPSRCWWSTTRGQSSATTRPPDD